MYLLFLRNILTAKFTSYMIYNAISHTMGKYIPKTASARQLQTGYRKILNEVKSTCEPIIIVSNNRQEAVILDIDTYERLREVEREHAHKELLKAIKEYRKDKKEGKLIKLNSLMDLIK